MVNKADRSGVEATASQLEAMLAMERDAPRHAGWTPPVVQTIASQGKGLDDLLQAIEGHRKVLIGDDGKLLAERRRERARMEVVDILQARTLRMLEERLEKDGRLDEMADAIADGRTDPYSASETIMKGLF